MQHQELQRQLKPFNKMTVPLTKRFALTMSVSALRIKSMFSNGGNSDFPLNGNALNNVPANLPKVPNVTCRISHIADS